MDSHEVIKKRNKILIAYLVLLALMIIAMILIAIFVDDADMMNLINVSILILMLIVTALFRSPLLGYSNMAKIAKIVLNQSKPIKFKRNIVDDPNYLISQGFTLYGNTHAYQIYQRIDELPTLKIRKITILNLAVIIKDNGLDYYDKNLHDDIQKLESTFTRKNKPTRYIITAYKSLNGMSQQDIQAIGEVVNYNLKKYAYTQINVGLNKKDHKAYFLYSDQYVPGINYKNAIEFIKKSIS